MVGRRKVRSPVDADHRRATTSVGRAGHNAGRSHRGMGAADGGDPVHASVQRYRPAGDLAAPALERSRLADRSSSGRRLRARGPADPGVFTTRAGAAVERSPTTDLRVAKTLAARPGADSPRRLSIRWVGVAPYG